MTTLGKFNKSPDERKRYTINYTDWLDTNERIDSASFEVSPSGSLEVDAWQINDLGNVLAFFVAGGNDEATYEVLVKCTTDGGQIKETAVLFAVREL